MYKHIYCVFLAIYLFWPAYAIGQTSLKEVSVQYNNSYQLGRSYTVIYDNVSAPAKLKTFKISFFGPGGIAIGETKIETYPVSAKIAVFELPRPIKGFNAINLNVLSLYSGDISSLPSGQPVLALNEDNKMKASPPAVKPPEAASGTPASHPPKQTPANHPPEARRANFDIQAGADEVFNIADYYSDIDGEPVILSEKSGQISGLSYSLTKDGTVKIQAPDHLGSYEIPYEVTDQSGAGAQGLITVTSIAPSALSPALSTTDKELTGEVRPANTLPIGWILLFSAGLIAAGLLLLKPQALRPSKASKTPPVIKAPARKLGKTDLIKNVKFAGNGEDGFKKAMAFPTSSSALARLNPAAGQPSSSPLAGADEKPNYRPVGRIGQAWGAGPLEDDFSLGTGLLISERHVITNWHVFDLYGKYLQAGHLQEIGYQAPCWGIEFMAYAENADQPELAVYLPFDGNPPKVLPGLDLVIYTLAEPVSDDIKDRITLTIQPIPTGDILSRDFELVGHPDPFEFPSDENDKADVLAFGDDPVFAVKRVSPGQILPPSAINGDLDDDAPLLFEHGTIGPIEVVCHNATTLGGGSGSPLIDPKTGELLGIHFRCVPGFHGQDVNMAMPVSAVFKAIEDFLPQA